MKRQSVLGGQAKRTKLAGSQEGREMSAMQAWEEIRAGSKMRSNEQSQGASWGMNSRNGQQSSEHGSTQGVRYDSVFWKSPS